MHTVCVLVVPFALPYPSPFGSLWVLARSINYVVDFETSYEVTDDAFPSCAIDRPSGANADGRMGLVNHMLHIDILGIQIPDLINADKTNSLNSIDAQAGICEGVYGRTPNVILLDYVNLGDAMGAQAALNGL